MEEWTSPRNSEEVTENTHRSSDTHLTSYTWLWSFQAQNKSCSVHFRVDKRENARKAPNPECQLVLKQAPRVSLSCCDTSMSTTVRQLRILRRGYKLNPRWEDVWGCAHCHGAATYWYCVACALHVFQKCRHSRHIRPLWAAPEDHHDCGSNSHRLFAFRSKPVHASRRPSCFSPFMEIMSRLICVWECHIDDRTILLRPDISCWFASSALRCSR